MWNLTVVYGSPHLQLRSSLWDALRDIAMDISCPWAVVGDFNTIMHEHERKGGAVSPSLRGYAPFNRCMRDRDLIDGGFQGYPFTYKRSNLEQRLDRLVMNISWCMRFQEAVVVYLLPFTSDHRPLLIKLETDYRTNRRRRPFRFVASWITHSDFNWFMRQNWNSSLPWNT